MSLAELQALEFPTFRKLRLKRRFLRAYSQIRRTTKSQIRHTRSKFLAIYRRQYFLTHAIADTRTATKRNEDIFIANVMAAFAVSFSGAMIAFELFMLFLQTAYDLANFTGISMPALTAVALGVLSLLGSWVAVFLLNSLSLAVMEGANRKIYRSVRRTFRIALSRAGRVTEAWLMFLTVVVGPVLYMLMAGAMYINAYQLSEADILRYLPYAAISALTWVIFMLMQYGLVPWIAFFEPSLRLRDTFARSRRLLSRRGHLFILFTNLILVAGIVGFYKLTSVIHSVIGLGKEPLFAFGAIALAITANGIMVSLYRKRKLAHSTRNSAQF